MMKTFMMFRISNYPVIVRLVSVKEDMFFKIIGHDSIGCGLLWAEFSDSIVKMEVECITSDPVSQKLCQRWWPT